MDHALDYYINTPYNVRAFPLLLFILFRFITDNGRAFSMACSFLNATSGYYLFQVSVRLTNYVQVLIIMKFVHVLFFLQGI